MVRGTDSAIQRLQVGLVGLLVVLLFVSIANMLSDGAEGGAKSGGVQSAQPASKEPVVEEPLGEMGVTPVVPEQPEKQPAKAPAPAKSQP